MVAGFEIVLMLGGGFRSVIAGLHRELAQDGHPDARPLHGFALQAVGPDGGSIADLSRALGVSRQAAAKTVSRLEELGYLTRRPEPTDARAVRVVRTAKAEDLLRKSASYFEAQAGEWRALAGAREFDQFVSVLALIGRDASIGDLPGWLS